MAKNKKVEIRIIQTSDVHGCFFPYDFINRKEKDGTLARVSTYVNQLREEYGKNLLLLDNGDILQGQPTCYYSNYINTDTLKQNYEKKIHHTTMLGKALFKTDQKKKDTYDNVKVFLNENEVNRPFEVTAYGSYTPLVIPLLPALEGRTQGPQASWRWCHHRQQEQFPRHQVQVNA